MPTENTNSDKVIELWSRLESWMNERNKGKIDDMIREPQYARFHADAMLLRNLRNILTHNDRDSIRISDKAVSRIESFVSLVTDESLDKYMIPFDRLCVAKRTDNVRPFLDELIAKNYSYLPIVAAYDNPICLHVFSANTLMVYVAKHTIDDSTTFADIDDCVNENDGYRKDVFRSVKSPLIDVVGLFKPDARFHTDVVLITEDGKRTSPLLGMITVWNIMEIN